MPHQNLEVEEGEVAFPLKKLRLYVTLGALVVAFGHLVFPGLAIDGITVALVVIALLPWLTPLIKSLDIPGVGKIEFQDTQKVRARASNAGFLSASPIPSEETFAFQSLVEQDPNLALAGLRIELERRLVRLAQASGIEQRRPQPMGRVLRQLTDASILSTDQSLVLQDMSHLLNGAVHGAEVDKRVAQSAIETGMHLLATLDERISEV